jgi:hypothetical protein
MSNYLDFGLGTLVFGLTSYLVFVLESRRLQNKVKDQSPKTKDLTPKI